MWDVSSFPDPRNKEKKLDIILHNSRFPLNYVKLHIQIIQKESEADHYVVQNLMWSVVYLRSTLLNNFLQKILTLVLLAATGPEVFVANMTKFFSDSYYALEENLTHTKSIKLNNYPGKNVTDCCASILVDAQYLESVGAFNPDHLG